jgi:hypothetical protein
MTINLKDLEIGYPGISKNIGAYLMEATIFCLEMNNHESSIVVSIEGKEDIELIWETPLTNQIKRSWRDTKETVEYGAVGLSLLLIHHFTEFVILERSYQGTGFDYWLGNTNFDENIPSIVQRKARLEISGILKESSKNKFSVRIKQKIKQVEKYDWEYPVYIVIVEFSFPKAKIINHE